VAARKLIFVCRLIEPCRPVKDDIRCGTSIPSKWRHLFEEATHIRTHTIPASNGKRSTARRDIVAQARASIKLVAHVPLRHLNADFDAVVDALARLDIANIGVRDATLSEI
jgi:hypothetical protein